MHNIKINKSKAIVFTFGTLLIVLVILGFSYQRDALANPKPTPTFFDPNSDLIKSLEDNLKLPNIPKDQQKLLEGKLQNLYREATRRVRVYEQNPSGLNESTANSQANSASEEITPVPLAGVPTPDDQIPRGIVDFPTTNFYNVENGWQDQINGEWVQVFAGSDPQDPQQGQVIIMSDHGHTMTFKTPQKTGSVRIIAVDNYKLSLESGDGTRFYFDVPGQVFVDSLEEIIPTITPTPVTMNPLTRNDVQVSPAYP